MTGGFDTHGPSNHLLCALMEDVLKRNISIHLIESHTTGQNADVPDVLKNFENFSFSVVNSTAVKKTAFVKRYLTYVKYAFKCIKHLKRQKDIYVVFVQSCPTAPFQVALTKLFVKKPIVYNIQDMFPGSAIVSGVMKRKWTQWLFSRFHKIAYSNANYISVISDDMKQRVIEQGVPEEKIVTIVDWYDDRSVHEVKWSKNRFVKKYNLSIEKFYVQYAGTMGFVFDYKMVLNVAERLKSYKDIEFHMIGQGSQKNAFIREKEERKLENIVFFPLEPQSMVSDVYSACSICFIPLKRGIIGNSVPSKVGLLMACNRTIVNSVDEDSNYYRMFHQNNMGISASNYNIDAVTNAILTLYKDKDKRNIFARNSQEFGKNHYARSINTKKYIELFSNVSNKTEK